MSSSDPPIRLAGVFARHQGRVALVRESHEEWGGTSWSIPSGHVEVHESPQSGATRELLEETGLIVATSQLELVGTVSVTAPSPGDFSWNFTVSVEEPDDPDGLIEDVGWFDIRQAARLLRELPYRPLSQPSVAILTAQVPARTHWTYPTAVDEVRRTPGAL